MPLQQSSSPRSFRAFLSAVVFVTTAISTTAIAMAAANSLPWDEPHFSSDARTFYDAASSVHAPGGADVLVLDEEEKYSFDSDGRQVYTHYLVYKVLTQKGAESWDSIGVRWEPWHDQRPAVKARVITSDYEVHDLGDKAISDAPATDEANETYGDRRVLRAPLPAIAPGAVVEEERTVRESSPFFSAGSVSRIYVGRSVPVQRTRLVLEAPSSLPMHYEIHLLPDVHPQRREADGRVTVDFEIGPMDALEDEEPLFPSDVPAYPSVTFSMGESWKRIAGEYSRIVDRQIAGVDVKGLVGKLTGGQATGEARTPAIVEYLNHNVRYTGVEFGENSIIPHSPAETLKQKYGDCKDKSALLVTMLRAAGIPAWVALLDAGSDEDIAGNLPGMGMFNHAIVYVPGPPELWIDATDEYARLGQLPSGDQGRFALVAREENNTLVRTPVSASAQNLVVEKREFTLMENGPARVVEVTEPHGSFESQYRSFYADKDNDERKKGLTEYVKEQYLAEKLDRMERSDPRDFSKQFQLTLETQKARRGITELSTAVAAIRLEALFDRLPQELRQREPEETKDSDPAAKPKKKRTADYQLRLAYVTEWQYTIIPPAGFRPKPLPQNAKMNAGPAVLTEEFSADPSGTVHALLRFDTVKSRLTVAEANDMRDQIVRWKEAEATLIYFEPTAQALLKEGKVREGFQAYRDLIALHPKEAVHHLQMADALLQAGLGDAAREHARQAAKLDPQSALAQQTLANVLEYDLVGRKFRPGSDYTGAEAAFRAAQKLDPDDNAITGNLAILLEYNQEGRRYGVGAPLKQAVEQYRRLKREQLEKLGLRNNPAFALFYAGEFAEAEQSGKAQNPQLNALIVASEAALNGSQAALNEANKRTSGDDARKQTLKTAGEMLMSVRNYPPAADLMEAGAAGDTASRTAGLAAILRKARHHEDIVPTPDAAGTAVRVFLMLAEPNLTQEKLLALSSRNARKVMSETDADETKQSLQSGRVFRRMIGRSGSSPDVAMDIVLQAMEVKVEGADATGYRAKVKVPGGKNLTFFVVKEDGAYKLLDSSEKPNAIGLEVLDRIAAGNLDGARILLDWLREEQHLAGGDDPLAGEAFARMWTKGKDSDAAGMKLVAAAILVQTKATAKDGVDILEAARGQAGSDGAKLNIALALLTGYWNLDQNDKLLAIASELAQEYPESRRVFLNQSAALRALGRFEEADRVAQVRLTRLPDDIEALRASMHSAVSRGDYALAYERAQAAVKSEKSEAVDKNNLAWASLFKGSVGQEDVEAALSAVQANQNSGNALHTLGCVYTEAGKTREAREVLVQAMDLENLDEPNEAFWYAFGRIAEQYGERETAIANYNRVTKPKKAVQIPWSPYWLAQNRLKAMAATDSGKQTHSGAD